MHLPASVRHGPRGRRSSASEALWVGTAEAGGRRVRRRSSTVAIPAGSYGGFTGGAGAGGPPPVSGSTRYLNRTVAITGSLCTFAFARHTSAGAHRMGRVLTDACRSVHHPDQAGGWDGGRFGRGSIASARPPTSWPWSVRNGDRGARGPDPRGQTARGRSTTGRLSRVFLSARSQIHVHVGLCGN
jgi:hypothetical protein